MDYESNINLGIVKQRFNVLNTTIYWTVENGLLRGSVTNVKDPAPILRQVNSVISQYTDWEIIENPTAIDLYLNTTEIVSENKVSNEAIYMYTGIAVGGVLVLSLVLYLVYRSVASEPHKHVQRTTKQRFIYSRLS
jgi:hypothetical protein